MSNIFKLLLIPFLLLPSLHASTKTPDYLSGINLSEPITEVNEYNFDPSKKEVSLSSYVIVNLDQYAEHKNVESQNKTQVIQAINDLIPDAKEIQINNQTYFYSTLIDNEIYTLEELNESGSGISINCNHTCEISLSEVVNQSGIEGLPDLTEVNDAFVLSNSDYFFENPQGGKLVGGTFVVKAMETPASIQVKKTNFFLKYIDIIMPTLILGLVIIIIYFIRKKRKSTLLSKLQML